MLIGHDPQMDGATAARSGSSAAANSRPFTSALDIPLPPLLRPTTALRRRGSDGGFPSSRDSSNRHHNHHRHRHPKSPSMDSPTELHPLRRSGTTPKTPRYDDDDRGNTRPRLSRLLSPSEPVLASARPLDDPPLQPERAESHRTVLAHKVLPNDTLAGVALRYGISVTDLRRANQLWASDSIHLRQVLYVPLDKARYADLETVASLLAQRADNEDIVPTAAPGPHLNLDPRTSDSSSFIRRIPSASLSFFPPPSSTRPSTPPPAGPPFASVSSSTSPFHSRSHSPATVGTHSRGGGPNLSSGLRATNALSSLFSILPINASTRDEIMSRLSVDSVSNSTTGTASDEAEHELTAVPTTPKPRRAGAQPTTLSAPLAVRAQRKKSPAHTWLSESSSEPYSGYGEPDPRDVEQIALASSPIHTMQMQPAPTMQLPESMTRSPPKGCPSSPPPPPNDPHSNVWRASGGDHRRTR